MSADKESSQKGWSERIGELGPAWITAIAGLMNGPQHASGSPANSVM